MSMTREEAIERLERLKGSCQDLAAGMPEEPRWVLYGMALDMALTALRGPTREQVERMFRGCADCQRKTCVSCRRFGRVPERCIDCNDQDKWSPWNFCPVCGKPMSDEAVDILWQRWKEAVDGETD